MKTLVSVIAWLGFMMKQTNHYVCIAMNCFLTVKNAKMTALVKNIKNVRLGFTDHYKHNNA